MNKMPGFTAETACYTTSGYYRTSRNGANNLATRMMGVIQPAEVINVHGCRPGHILVDNEDGSFECFPDPLTEPPGGGLPDSGVPPHNSPGGGGGGGGGGGRNHPPKRPPKEIPLGPGRQCSVKERASEKGKRCTEQILKDIASGKLREDTHYHLCFGSGRGSELLCCVGDSPAICDVEEV